VGENVCGGKLILLALRRLAGIRGEGGDVDQPGNAVISPRRCDNGSAVRVADENGRAADPPQCALHCRDVACECVEAVLGSDHLVSLRPKGGITLLKDEPSAQIPWTNTMLGLVCMARRNRKPRATREVFNDCGLPR